MCCDFYLVKNHEIGFNSTTAKAKEKVSTDLELQKFIDVDLAKFENNKIKLFKI